MGGLGVPQRIVCSGCGYSLYEGDLLRSPQDIIKKYSGRCPKCNKKLGFSSEGVTVSPFKGNDADST